MKLTPLPPKKKFLVPAVLVLCYSSMCLVQICGIIAVDFLWNYQQSYENIPLSSQNIVFQNLIEDLKQHNPNQCGNQGNMKGMQS